MKKQEIIKKILKLGFKECKPNVLQGCNRYWHKKLKDELFIGVTFWEHSKAVVNGKDTFEIEVYHDNGDFAEEVKIYAFEDFNKAYKQALAYTKTKTKT